MFDEVVLTAAEYDAFVIACLETEFGAEYPDAADFVRDEGQRFLDSRARLLTAGAGHLDAAVEADRAAAVAAARRASELAAFARARPAAMFDRAPGERGAASAASRATRPAALTEVSEWAVDEAAVMLRVSGRTAARLLSDAVTLVEGLPGTHALLAVGAISPAHAQAMVDIVGSVASPATRAEIEAAVLPRATGQTVPALRACARRAVLRLDAAAAADRLATAVRDRQVRLDSREDGMSTLTILLTSPAGRACYEALSAYAKACEFDEDGNRDPRTRQQRMADCLTDLILRPHADRPVVQLVLTLITTVDTLTGQGSDAEAPAELDGDLVTAAQARELAYTLGLLPRPATDETAEDAGSVEGDSAGASPAPEQAVTAPARLLDARRLLDTALAERPRIAVTDPLTGTLLALTDSTELRAAAASGRGLGPPPATNAARPTDALYRFVKLRDRRCRFPGCRARARCCDLDHQIPLPHGPTAHDNLACLCEHHHRLSHQAPGWRLVRAPDGALVWTLPGGYTVTTRPPAFGTDDGSTPPVTSRPPTGRQRYAESLARIGANRPAPPDASIPY